MVVEEKKETFTIIRMSNKDKAELIKMCEILNCSQSEFIRTATREKIANESLIKELNL